MNTVGRYRAVTLLFQRQVLLSHACNILRPCNRQPIELVHKTRMGDLCGRTCQTRRLPRTAGRDKPVPYDLCSLRVGAPAPGGTHIDIGGDTE